MEQQSAGHLQLECTPVTIRVLTSRYRIMGVQGKEIDLIELPDAAYGEWILYDNDVPRFYFTAFDEAGTTDAIVDYAARHNLDISDALIRLLAQHGYTNVHDPGSKSPWMKIKIAERVRELSLLQVRAQR